MEEFFEEISREECCLGKSKKTPAHTAGKARAPEGGTGNEKGAGFRGGNQRAGDLESQPGRGPTKEKTAALARKKREEELVKEG